MIMCEHCGNAASCDTDLGKMCESCYDEFECNYNEWARFRDDVDYGPFEKFFGRVELDNDNE